ncbi:MAG: NAD(P)-dependent oxidoreductase [Myxococcales bacterium]|nr:NAD(P)-dependent oxidoreductase [Myxococcales bacterium]
MGAMGSRMARRLLAAGHRVVVYNRSPARCAALVDAGAEAATSVPEAVAGAAVVIAMVRDDEASRSLWLDPEHGALAAMGPGTLAVECSTLTPRWIDALARAMADRGVSFLDAPVVGSRPQADAGALVFLVGGEAGELERARPILATMGAAIHHVGAHGAGARLKLIVNGWFAVQVAALAELLGAAGPIGLEPAQTLEILGSLPITSPGLKGAGAAMLARQFAPLFPVELVEKDLGYLLSSAAEAGAETPLSTAARALYQRAEQAGLGGDNLVAVARLFESIESALPHDHAL